jgi:alginate O-acetyltransferase complex protein AlgI
MLFNSYSFLLAFLPATLAGFSLLGAVYPRARIGWLAGCSLFFYGWWDYRYVPLLLASILVNYCAGRYIVANAGTPRAKRMFIGAIALDLGLLGYYKYANFFLDNVSAIFGAGHHALGIILPIGISFFTFTQIAFLADAYAGKVREYRFVHYLLFVSYFPHLIAGPVLHHSEMMPQFDDVNRARSRSADLAVGLSIFAIGLAKKVLVADNLAEYANATFDGGRTAPTLLAAWGGVLAYTFQLYFDFSGYSDMAIGLARFFGTRFPLNFASPYKATNIVEFWRRWHMTLSRFLRDYLYIPLGGNRHGDSRRQVNLMITMLLGGLWHGAGWGFVLWGALHGFYLVTCHAWQRMAARIPISIPPPLARASGVVVTFVCVVFAWVYFRAPDLGTAHAVFAGMFGRNGIELPETIVSRLGPLRGLVEASGARVTHGAGAAFAAMWASVIVAATLAFAFPNTQEIMRRAAPALDFVRERAARSRMPSWRPTTGWAIAIGILFALGLLSLSRPTEFLYFQF